MSFEPVPTPTPAQIETVVDITMLTTAEVASMIEDYPDSQAVSNAKWAATLTDITTWGVDIWDNGGNVKKVGSIEFFGPSELGTRLDFRNVIRRRYGKAELLSESGSLAQISSLPWFSSRCY